MIKSPEEKDRNYRVQKQREKRRKALAYDGLFAAAKAALDIINSYSHVPAIGVACQLLIAEIEKPEHK